MVWSGTGGGIMGGGKLLRPRPASQPDLSGLTESERQRALTLRLMERATPQGREEAAAAIEPPLEEKEGLEFVKGVAAKGAREAAELIPKTISMGLEGLVGTLKHTGQGIAMWVTEPRRTADMLGAGVPYYAPGVAEEAGKIIYSPIQTMTDLVREPKKTLAERPLGVVLDLSTIATLGTGGLSGLAAKAGLAETATGRALSTVAKYAKYSDPFYLAAKGAGAVIERVPIFKGIKEGLAHGEEIGARFREEERNRILFAESEKHIKPVLDDLKKSGEQWDAMKVRMALEGEGVTGRVPKAAEISEMATLRETSRELRGARDLLQKFEAAADKAKFDPDAVAAARQTVETLGKGSAKRAEEVGRRLEVGRIAAAKTAAKAETFLKRADLSAAEQRVFDATKKVSEAVTKETTGIGVSESVFKDIEYKQFAKNLGFGDDLNKLTPAAIQAAKDIAKEMGLDIHYFPHQMEMTQVRRRFYEAIGKEIEGTATGQRRIGRVKTRRGAEGYLGGRKAEYGKAADVSLAQAAISDAKQAIKTVTDRAERTRLQNIIDRSEAYLVEANQRTVNFDFERAYERHIQQRSAYIALVRHIEDMGKRFGKLWKGEKLAEDEILLDADALVERGGQMIKAKDTALGALLRGQSSDEAVLDVIDETMDDLSKKVLTGEVVEGHKRVYVIKKRMGDSIKADIFAKRDTSLAGAFFDTTNDFLRYTVLSLSPRMNVNNVVGNTVLSLLAMNNPLHVLLPLVKKYRDMVPAQIGMKPLSSMEGAGKAMRTMQDAIKTARGPWHKRMALMALKPFDTFARTMSELNERVDTYFRKAIYLDKAVAGAKQASMKRFGAGTLETLEAIRKAPPTPEAAEAIIRQVNHYLPDYRALTPFERNIMRRAIPFYTFMKNMTLLGMRLPLEHSLKLNFMKKMSEMWYDATMDPFIPEYLRGGMVVGMSPDGNPIILSTGGMNPLGIVSDTMEGMARGNLAEILRQMAVSANPFAELVIESATGRESFLGRPFVGPLVTYDGKYLDYNPTSGRIEEVIPPVSILDKLKGLIPHLNVVAPLYREIMGEPRSFANLKTGEVRVPGLAQKFPALGTSPGAEAANEVAKLFGVNLKGVNIERQKEMQKDLLKKLFSQTVHGNLPDLTPEQLERVRLILVKNQRAVRGGNPVQGLFR